ncbi:MAG: cytochrome bd ubiquinol oxidase subunit [Bacteroidales bacterium]|jgi:cytochrome d ubiquinol oxidase subunit I|nr:cytochrome bd ubiquinol oxidase subunit [Bacteroidales bacterium]MDN5330339.1 cytochrome bd ubiquinol oxidase subunit [Bacteroidales bacterium]
MMNIDPSLVEWSRWQFALTAMFHWIFVPLTLGITFLIAIMESIYVKTGDPEWKRITKFWMTLFGINFAIGVATGIILEFEFGTNWSNYSWFVGDIFGAPLAVEGIMAFFLETTFLAVMFFGWNKVSKKVHLLSTWLVAIGSNLSALWILVANAWMQNPTGTRFNPDTARNEMTSFWEVLFSPTAINKFLHTVSSSYLLASIFVIGVSAWYLLKNREKLLARRSIIVSSVFGFIFAIYTALTGDSSSRHMAQVQPLKFAAMENLYEGQSGAPFVAVGITRKIENNEHQRLEFISKIEIPNVLSYLAYLDPNAFVPGIKDLVHGNPEKGVMGVNEKMEKGRMAISALRSYKEFQAAGETAKADSAMKVLEANYRYFGYGYFEDPHQAIPPIRLTFVSFRVMVYFGFLFILMMLYFVYHSMRDTLEKRRWILVLAIFAIPLVYLVSQAGWIVAEVGRQPWIIQDLMPTFAAVSHLEVSSVKLTFWLFAITFTILFIAEVRIMLAQIKNGPKDGGK